jgi:FKBP-type peptidyl-prolyl cis-trans isomerase 2
MSEVKSGDKVAIHYKGTLDDGTVFDSSEGRDPLEFTVGSGQIIPGLDKAMPGMTVGEEKTVRAVAAEAYGEAHPDATQAVPRADIPAVADAIAPRPSNSGGCQRDYRRNSHAGRKSSARWPRPDLRD